jgi:probable HAF family extracellular repeat protein
MRSHDLSLRRILVVSAGAVALASPAAVAATFVPLGFLPGGTSSVARDFSGDGSTVVGYSAGNAFRWTSAGGMVALDQSAGFFGSDAYGVSADGSTVVGDAGTGVAFRWTPADGMVGLGFLPGKSASSIAFDVSGDGATAVGYSTDGHLDEAFRWTSAGGMVGLGFLPGGTTSDAYGISGNGATIVGQSTNSAGFNEAFLWTSAGGMVGLGFASGGFSSAAFGISADGSTIVGDAAIGVPPCDASGNCHHEAFRWTSASVMVGLGLPPGFQDSFAFDVSADGSVVVGSAYDSASHTYSAVFWDAANGMRPLDEVLVELGVDLTGWRLSQAEAVSSDGLTLVGFGTNPSGQLEGWIATIPEPGTGLLLMTGLLGVAYWQRRHGKAA